MGSNPSESTMRIFNINYNNRLSFTRIFSLTTNYKHIHYGYWLNGRIFGKFITIIIKIPSIFLRTNGDERLMTEKEKTQFDNFLYE